MFERFSISVLIIFISCFVSFGQSFDQEIVYKQVDQMPAFAGCDDVTGDELTECSNKNLIQYIIDHLKYPQGAKDKGIEGRVFVSFVVGAEGVVRDVQVTRGIDEDCNQAAKNIVESMPDWSAGVKDGRSVAVQLTMPFTFKLPKEKKN